MILITGAGRRVGYALAERCLSLGQKVIAHYHQASEELSHLAQLGAHTLQADFNDRHSVQQMLAEIAELTPDLRAIIHNASAFSPSSQDSVQALAQLDQFYQIHVASPWQINSALTPQLMAYDGIADIVHITDIYADNPNPMFDVYCASKAALQNLSLSFAKKLAPKVKVNVIQPGPILFKEWHSEAAKKAVLDETLLKFEAGPEPIIKAVLSVLDNPYQTGAVIAVDGGRRLT